MSSSDAGGYPISVTQGSLSAANYLFAFVDGTLTVSQVATTTGLSVTPGRTVYGQSVTLTAQVNLVQAVGGVATGMVLFEDNGSVLSSGTLTNGLATLTSTTLAVGGHNFTATGGAVALLSSSFKTDNYSLQMAEAWQYNEG